MIAALQHRLGEFIQDRYEIQGVLGSGAFGTVYRCCDRELDTLVAIKELHVLDDPVTAKNERDAALAQFRQEAIHLSHLRHPHIVSGHYQPHSGTWLVCPLCGHSFRGVPRCPEHNLLPVVVRQRHYLVMEYVDGPNLAEAAETSGGILEVSKALWYIRQIAEALQLIHAKGWVHRDVKPENIRVRAESDDAVLLDFGIATATGAEGQFSTREVRHTTGGGTFGYAPESPLERRYPDARSDIHALGMTLYRLLSGRDPQEPDDLADMRMQRPRDFNTAIPLTLEALILKAIDPDPERRPQNIREFAQAVFAIVEPPAPVPLGSPGAPVPPLRFASGEVATNVPELVHLMDKYPQESKEYLYSGDLMLWLAQIGRVDLAQRGREIREQFPNRKRQGLEALAQFTGIVEPPRMDVQPPYLDFGSVPMGTSKTLDVHLRNVGRGFLFGELRSTFVGLEFPAEFDGNQANIPVTLRAKHLQGGRHHGELVIDSSAGEVRLTFSATVDRRSPAAAVTTVTFWAMMGMLCGQFMRTLPLIGQPDPPGWQWLNSSTVLHWFPSAPLFGFALWGSLMLFVVGEALRRKSCWVLFGGGFWSLVLAFVCALTGDQCLIAGDMAMKPFMSSLTHQWAAGGWMFMGGVLGACYGTLRRLRDVFSQRLVFVLGGWLVAMLLLYGILGVVHLVVPAYN
ncbi:MAG: serine/threonine protein kinase [Abitibacteriaceae bacterium]|nr:serine/threonine protein kinase [Abditibacteriaceae bacterium]